jgi:DNA polymerase alpha-associated DNA helicase A
LLDAKKVILAGDHLQLGPFSRLRRHNSFKFSSKKCLESELTGLTLGDGSVYRADYPLSLFERLLDSYGAKYKRKLEVQYRSNEAIMQFAADTLYVGRLTAHEDVRISLLKDLKGVKDTDETRVPLVFWDTQGDLFREDKYEGQGTEIKRKPFSESKSNSLEARLVCVYVQRLLTANVSEGDIAVVAPYSAQVFEFTRLLKCILTKRSAVSFLII